MLKKAQVADTTKAANLKISSILFKVCPIVTTNKIVSPPTLKKQTKKRQTHKTISKQLKSFSARVSNSFTTLSA